MHVFITVDFALMRPNDQLESFSLQEGSSDVWAEISPAPSEGVGTAPYFCLRVAPQNVKNLTQNDTLTALAVGLPLAEPCKLGAYTRFSPAATPLPLRSGLPLLSLLRSVAVAH